MFRFELNGLLFEYDAVKARKNKKKHRIAFLRAAEIFFDPSHRTDFNRTCKGENRWETIGRVGSKYYFVVHTDRVNENGQKVIRLISARKAETKERKRVGYFP